MDGRRLRLNLVLAAALAALTIVVYAPVRGFTFLNFDDHAYVVDNVHISRGLSSENVVWSLTAFENGNWHPLTLLAHMLDVQFFGLDPAGHHVVNLVLHIANVLLLFWLLAWATSQPWPSVVVAALFAVHPLNVETVAWISELKSLLSTTFWILALLAHVSYRRTPDAKRYVLILVLAALALAAKPMAVTLPLTLVLVDAWPLGIRPKRPGSGWWRRYLLELAPFLVLSGACGVLTLLAQREAHALQTFEVYSWPIRLGNALVSYAWYLKTMAWPAGLAAFYPHPVTTLAATEIVASALMLIVICAAVAAKGRSFPALTAGWLWYVVTLLPVSGIIQVGSQAYADRYAYVPLVGVFVMVVWSAVRLSEAKPAIWRRALAIVGVAWIVALSLATHAELPYWHDSVSLFRRAIEVVPENAFAHVNLGMALVEQNKILESLEHFQKAVLYAPWDTDARSNVGNALRTLGRPAEAVVVYEQALDQAPDDASIHYNLATALVDLGRVDEAKTRLREAERLDPAYTKAWFLLGTILYEEGRAEDALAQFREVARLDPRDVRAVEWVRRIERQLGR